MDETLFLLSGEERKEAARSRRLQTTPAVVSRGLQFTFAALVLICSYIILVCSCLSFSFFPQVSAHRKGSSADTEVGVYAGGNQLAVCIASFISGAYMNKIGVKFLLVSGSFLVAGSSVIFGFVDDISSWKPFIGLSTVIYFVMGLGQGAFLTTCTTVFVRMFPTRIATAWSVISLTLGLGFLTSSPLGGLLYDSEGFAFPYVVFGSILFLLIPFFVIFPSDTYVESELSDAVNQTPIWLLLKMMPVLVVCVNTFVAYASVPLIQVSLSQFLYNTFHWRASQIGLVFLVFGIAFVGSSIVIGVVIDATNPRAVMIIGLLIGGCGMMLVGPSFVFSFSLQSWLVYFSMVLIGLGTCMVLLAVPIDMTATAVSRGHEENISLIAAVTGLWNAATYFSGTVAGPVGGALTASFGFRYSTSFFAFAIFCAFIMTIVSTVVKLYHS
ncbi:MFS-type transporter SLC18B1-like [Corticium candelabrum]|uniref:MFS-type transporter SLC18B1-like n=1 Tax=Corticium candelabrum TaxID=121492 RepID=UPI002E2621B2|nr:MFS-type transporter SLC18B1-like [Corticium candelabrum]